MMLWAVKLKVTDHQCSVPLGFSGKTSRSSSVSGMFLIADRFMTAFRSWGPYAVGKNFSISDVATMCVRRATGLCAGTPVLAEVANSARIAR